MGVGGQRHALPTLPQERDPMGIGQEAGWALGPFGWVRKFSPPPEFDPRTSQFVASCYTDNAIPAHTNRKDLGLKCCNSEVVK
jgi:hypothetical protein